MNNFVPQEHMFCLRCGKHFMVCPCEGITHGQDLCYVLDPTPEHLTVMQRIERWATLVMFHPSLGRLDAKQYVMDLPSSFEHDMASTKPIIMSLMEQYKSTTLKDTAQIMGITTDGGMTQLRKDCDYVMEHFFKGNWGYPLFTYIPIHSFRQLGQTNLNYRLEDVKNVC